MLSVKILENIEKYNKSHLKSKHPAITTAIIFVDKILCHASSNFRYFHVIKIAL